MKFHRETATEAADLPHRFEGEKAACDLCAREGGDPRHHAWEKQDLHDREIAAADLKREFGS